MKKIISFAVCCICASLTVSAQSKSTTNSSFKLSQEVQHASIAPSRPSKLGLVQVVSKPIAKLIIQSNANTPVENAGKSLTRAGRYLYWGTMATVVGQIFTLVGEPTSGSLFTICGTAFVYVGYSEITRAGRHLQQTSNE